VKELLIVMIGVINEIKWEYKWNVHKQKSGIIHKEQTYEDEGENMG